MDPPIQALKLGAFVIPVKRRTRTIFNLPFSLPTSLIDFQEASSHMESRWVALENSENVATSVSLKEYPMIAVLNLQS